MELLDEELGIYEHLGYATYYISAATGEGMDELREAIAVPVGPLEQVLRRLRQTQPEVRVVMITAHGTVDNAVQTIVDVSQDPVTLDQLIARLDGLAPELVDDDPDGDVLSWIGRELSGLFVVRREDYVYLVPFVEDEQTVFLKTIIPSRKATKQYLGEESDDET